MTELQVIINGEHVTLDNKTNIEVLKAYTNKAYTSGAFTIKNGSELSRCFKALLGDEKHFVDEKTTYKSILKSLEFANTKGAFTLDDSENLYTVFEYTKSQLE
jgi:hypothetical protein